MRCCTLQSRPQCIVAAGEGGGGISRSKAALQGRRGEPCAMAACASSFTAFCCCCCCWSVRFATNDERMRAKTPAPFAAVGATTAAAERWGTAVGNERMCLSVSVVDRAHREVSLSLPLSCSSVDTARMTGVPCCCCCSWSLRACSSARQDQNASRAQTSTHTHTHLPSLLMLWSHSPCVAFSFCACRCCLRSTNLNAMKRDGVRCRQERQ